MHNGLRVALLIGFLVSQFSSYAAAGDYAWWPLDDGSGAVARNLVQGGTEGDIIAYDTAGLASNGSVWVNDPERGMVLGLNGTTGWVEAGELPIMTLENGFSWSFWAKQSGVQAVNNDIIIGNRYDVSGVDTVPREFVKFTPTQFEYHINGVGDPNLPYDPFGGMASDAADIPSNDQWIHHAVVKQGDSLVYYRDGIAETSRTITVGMGSPDPLPFAMGGQNGVETWRGYLSDVQLYESALDSDGVAATMAGDAADGTLYARWMLNDGDGATAVDQGPNNFDGDIFDWDIDGLAADGTVWVDDPDRGTVLGLGGNTAWVDAGELPLMDLENDFTWTFWARQDPDQATPANDIVIGNRYDVSGADTVPREFIKFTPDRFEFHMEGAGAGDLQYADPEDGPWVHHLVVKDGDTIAYYRDGELQNEGVINEDQLSPDPLPFYMGGQNGAETWAGYLSDVQLFDHALSQMEIDDLYNGQPTIPGDFDNSGALDVADIDQLTVESASGNNNPGFDLTGDGKVNVDDVTHWAIELKNTWIGDADLNGEFNSSDLVVVLAAGAYEADVDAVWSSGDFNGDGRSNSSDLVAALGDGGYEIGPRAAVSAVPEPSGIYATLIACFGAIAGYRRRTCKARKYAPVMLALARSWKVTPSRSLSHSTRRLGSGIRKSMSRI